MQQESLDSQQTWKLAGMRAVVCFCLKLYFDKFAVVVQAKKDLIFQQLISVPLFS